MKRAKYFIQDWAGNECFGGRTFAEFEDAWDYIYAFVAKEVGEDDNAFDEACGEYEVMEIES